MDRLASASARDVLEKVQPAIAAGSVNILSVDAIRRASGDRWPRKREQVEHFIERTFGRLTQPGDMVIGLNDTEFVTVQPGVGCSAALSVSAKVLKESLAFFLGKAAIEDLQLFQVTSFVGGAFTLERAAAAELGQVMEPGRYDGADATAEVAGGGRRPAAPPANDLEWRVGRSVRLVSPPDLDLDLQMAPEPTWNVAARVVASYLLRPTISLGSAGKAPREVRTADLSPNMAGEAAVAMLAYAADIIARRQAVVALHAPIALAAVTYSASRYRVLNALRDLQPEVRRLLILDLVDLTEGLPQSRLEEVVSVLAPCCRTVLARAPSETADVRVWRRCGLSGVTLDCGRLDPADTRAQPRLSAFAQRAAEAKLSCVGYNLPDRTLMLAAWAAGFTHVGGPLLSMEVGPPESVRRLTPAELFLKGLSAGDASLP